MRTAKILGIVVGGIFAVIALVLVSVWLFVNPNHYKDKITAAVKSATGRDLLLQGDIKLSVFPWVALELGPASLGNPAGFPAQPFVSFEHVAVRVKLLPLLHEALEVDRLEIAGLDLRLLKNAAGKGNWEGFGKADTAPESPPETAPATAPKAAPGELPVVRVPSIKITNSRLSYEQYAVENINLETAPFANGTVPIALRFDANRGVADEHGTVEIKVDLSNPGPQHYRLAALNVVGQANEAGNPRPLKLNFSVPALDADLQEQTLAAPNWSLILAGAQLTGSVSGSKIVDDPTITGSLALAPLVVREFLPRLGIAVPPTREARALSSVAASASFAYGGDALRADKVELTLDETHVRGEFSQVVSSGAIKFKVTVDQINLDNYLPPEGQPTTAAAQPAAPATASKTAPAKPLDAEGTLAVGAVQAAGLALTNVQVTLLARAGVIHLFPLQAQLYDGRYSGDITLDSRGKVPAISLDEHLTAIDMSKLAASKPKSLHLSGKGNVNIKAAGQGAGADGILKTLDGHTDFYVTDGAVEGVDLGYQLGRAEALLKRTDLPAAQDTNRTKFDALKMSAQITNGVATTKDLNISSQVIKVTGQGSANLATRSIDFAVLADTLRSANGIAIQVPVKITGTAADPTVRPDLEALAKGQIGQKVKDVLQDKLKGLFGKP